MLPENNNDELLYRLRTRVALLLGDNLEQRKDISKNIRDLYKTRSEIVHNGSYQVTDADLSLIRAYSKRCILHLVSDSSLVSMSDIGSLFNGLKKKH